MANDFDFGRGHFVRGNYDKTSSRDNSRYYDNAYDRYSEPPHDSGNYEEGRYQYRDRYNEPSSRRSERYGASSYSRSGDERGILQRTGDEVLSWFGDDEAEQRLRMAERRSQAGRGPRGYQRSDERIREDINDSLTDDIWLDASDIEVSVNQGVVTLSGRVNSRADKRHAEDLLENVKGVTDILNQLRIGQESSTATAIPVTSGAAAPGKAANT